MTDAEIHGNESEESDDASHEVRSVDSYEHEVTLVTVTEEEKIAEVKPEPVINRKL